MDLKLGKVVGKDSASKVRSVGGGLGDAEKFLGVQYWRSELEREGSG